MSDIAARSSRDLRSLMGGAWERESGVVTVRAGAGVVKQRGWNRACVGEGEVGACGDENEAGDGGDGGVAGGIGGDEPPAAVAWAGGWGGGGEE